MPVNRERVIAPTWPASEGLCRCLPWFAVVGPRSRWACCRWCWSGLSPSSLRAEQSPPKRHSGCAAKGGQATRGSRHRRRQYRPTSRRRCHVPRRATTPWLSKAPPTPAIQREDARGDSRVRDCHGPGKEHVDDGGDKAENLNPKSLRPRRGQRRRARPATTGRSTRSGTAASTTSATSAA